MKHKIFATIAVIALLFQCFGLQLFNIKTVKADDLPDLTYTIPTPTVTAALAGEDETAAAVQVFWNLPDGSEPDAYGFILCKQGPKAPSADDAQKNANCPAGTAFAANYYPSSSGFEDLTDSGYYYDEALVENDTYTYFVKAYDRSGVMSDWGQATIKIKFDYIKNIQVSPHIDTKEAGITWDTKSAASCSVDFGATSSYGQTAVAATTNDAKTSHSVTLSSLDTASGYHFQVKCTPTDGGSEKESDDKTFVFPFTINDLNTAVTPLTAKSTWKTVASAICDRGSAPDGISFLEDMTGLTPGKAYSYDLNCTKKTDITIKDAKKINFTATCTDMTEFNINTKDYFQGALINWKSPSNITGLIRYRKSGSANPWFPSVGYSGIDPKAEITGLLPGKPYDYEIYSGTVLPPDSNASCLARSGTFATSTTPTLTVTLDSQSPTHVKLHWKSSALLNGTITIAGGKTARTVQVPDYSRDQIIDVALAYNDLPLHIDSYGDGFNSSYCTNYSQGSVIFFAAGKTAPDPKDSNKVYTANANGPTVQRPAVSITNNSNVFDSATSSLSGNIKMYICPGYESYYGFSNIELTGKLFTNNGGTYTLAWQDDSKTISANPSGTSSFSNSDIVIHGGGYINGGNYNQFSLCYDSVCSHLYISSLTASDGSVNMDGSNIIDRATINYGTTPVPRIVSAGGSITVNYSKPVYMQPNDSWSTASTVYGSSPPPSHYDISSLTYNRTGIGIGTTWNYTPQGSSSAAVGDHAYPLNAPPDQVYMPVNLKDACTLQPTAYPSLRYVSGNLFGGINYYNQPVKGDGKIIYIGAGYTITCIK